MTDRNKQRLTKLTAAEKRAASRGGALDERIPLKKLERRLRDEPRHEFATERLFALLANRMGWIRALADSEASRMEPAKIAQQGKDSAGVIDELLDRLRHMHPELEARADLILRATRTHVAHALECIEPELLRVRAALLKAAKEIEATPTRTGPKQKERDLAYRAVAKQLQESSMPPMTRPDALALAKDLVGICESNPPE